MCTCKYEYTLNGMTTTQVHATVWEGMLHNSKATRQDTLVHMNNTHITGGLLFATDSSFKSIFELLVSNQDVPTSKGTSARDLSHPTTGWQSVILETEVCANRSASRNETDHEKTDHHVLLSTEYILWTHGDTL